MFVKLDRALLISFFLLTVDVHVAASFCAISLYVCRSSFVSSLHLHPDTLFFSDRVGSLLPSENKYTNFVKICVLIIS